MRPYVPLFLPVFFVFLSIPVDLRAKKRVEMSNVKIK
jgi:hypothetical protein